MYMLYMVTLSKQNPSVGFFLLSELSIDMKVVEGLKVTKISWKVDIKTDQNYKNTILFLKEKYIFF